MSIKVSVKDGTGTNLEAKVAKAGPRDEPSLWVHLADVVAGTSLPVFVGPITNSNVIDVTLLNGGSGNMAVDGDPTAVEFRLEADSTYDIVVNSIIFSGLDGSIKMPNFLGENSALTNGLLLSYKADDNISTYAPFKRTQDFLIFSSAGGFNYIAASGEDSMAGAQTLDPSFIIRKTGTHGAVVDDDYISCLVRDDIDTVSELLCTIRGFKVEAGRF